MSKRKEGDVVRGESLFEKQSKRNDLAVLKELVKDQKLYLVATFGPGKSGTTRGQLVIRPEWVQELHRGKAPVHGISTQVICEMIFDGDHLTVGQCFEGVVPQKG